MIFSERVSAITKRLFLNLEENFNLIFENGYYCLKDKKSTFCHPLEVCLIGKEGLSGNKIKDISIILKVKPKWILGFHHGLIENKILFKNKEYLEGFKEGLLVKEQISKNFCKY